MAYRNEKYTAANVLKITGVKRQRLHDWIDRGFLSPSIQRAEGAGTKNIFNRYDLYRIAIFKKLVEEGFPRARITMYIESVNEMIASAQEIIWNETAFFIWGHGQNKVHQDIILIYELDKRADKSFPIRFYLQQDHTKGTPFFDSVYILNFWNIKVEIDKKIEGL
jgi:DNA-binding transcriptional MerR regulator